MLTREEIKKNTKDGICSYCNIPLDIRSRFIMGDIDKEITLYVGYTYPKCGFMPMSDYKFSVKNTHFFSGELKRLLSPIKEEVKTNEPSDN